MENNIKRNKIYSVGKKRQRRKINFMAFSYLWEKTLGERHSSAFWHLKHTFKITLILECLRFSKSISAIFRVRNSELNSCLKLSSRFLPKMLLWKLMTFLNPVKCFSGWKLEKKTEAFYCYATLYNGFVNFIFIAQIRKIEKWSVTEFSFLTCVSTFTSKTHHETGLKNFYQFIFQLLFLQNPFRSSKNFLLISFFPVWSFNVMRIYEFLNFFCSC